MPMPSAKRDAVCRNGRGRGIGKRQRRQYRQMIQKYQKIDDNHKYKILPKKLFLLQKNTSFYLFPLK